MTSCSVGYPTQVNPDVGSPKMDNKISCALDTLDGDILEGESVEDMMLQHKDRAKGL